MKCQRVRGEVEFFRHSASSHPVRSRLHQQAEYVETIVLGKSSQGSNSIRVFHIPTNIESVRDVKNYFS